MAPSEKSVTSVSRGDGLTGHALRRRIDIACGMMFFLYGYDAGVLGGVIETPQFLTSIFGPSGTPGGQYDIPLIASSYTLAAFFATPIVMAIGMKTGRRRILLFSCALVVIGAIIQAASYGMVQIIIARIICGFGIGGISSTVPPYQTEQSIDESNRGRKTAITCCALIFGIPLAYWFDYGMSFINHSVSWRIPIAAQGIPALISGIIFWSCPDTPRWYYATGRENEGDRTLIRLFDEPIDSPRVMTEKLGILAALELEHKAPKPKVADFFWDRSELKVARRLVICFLVLSFQQLMSINFLVYYATIIFSNNGLDKNTSAILGAVMNTSYWTGTIPTIWLIDRIGRRGLMFRTSIICTILMTIFVVLLGLPVDKQTKASNWAASGLIIVYSWFFGLGWIACCWQYAPEISPLEYRHVGAALNASGEWLWSFVTVFVSPIAVGNPSVGWRIWIWYLVFNALAIPFTYFLPETARKNLEELDTLFCAGDKRNAIMEERSALMAKANQAVAERLGVDPKPEVSYYENGKEASTPSGTV